MRENVVLFICVENACRSLMAESMFNADPPPGWRALSAGTRPAAAPNARSEPMLAEIGLALPDHRPRELTKELMELARVRVTMGCLDDDSCPAHLRTLELRDWALEDPARQSDEGFRRIRDQIATLVRRLQTEISTESRPVAEPSRVVRPGAIR